MIILIEDENSERITYQVIKCDSSFSINTINWFSPTFHIFLHIGKMFKRFPYLLEFEREIKRGIYGETGRIGLQYFWSTDKKENVFSHFWS